MVQHSGGGQRDRIGVLESQIPLISQDRTEKGEMAMKLFELSQTLNEKWVTADYRTKRRLLQIVCLNFSLDDVTLVPTIKKPFDVLVKGLHSGESRGDTI